CTVLDGWRRVGPGRVRRNFLRSNLHRLAGAPGLLALRRSAPLRRGVPGCLHVGGRLLAEVARYRLVRVARPALERNRAASRGALARERLSDGCRERPETRRVQAQPGLAELRLGGGSHLRGRTLRRLLGNGVLARGLDLLVPGGPERGAIDDRGGGVGPCKDGGLGRAWSRAGGLFR